MSWLTNHLDAFNNWLTHSTNRSMARMDKAMYLMGIACFWIGLGNLLFWNEAAAPSIIVLGAVLIAQPGFRHSAMRSGWLLGRGALLKSLREARTRGLTEEQWLTAEFERDVAVMHGARIMLPEPIEEEDDGAHE